MVGINPFFLSYPPRTTFVQGKQINIVNSFNDYNINFRHQIPTSGYCPNVYLPPATCLNPLNTFWKHILSFFKFKPVVPPANFLEQNTSLQPLQKVGTDKPLDSVSPEVKAQRKAAHVALVNQSVAIIKDNFEVSGLSQRFKTPEDKALFMECLENVKYDENASGAGHAEKGVVFIETNDDDASQALMLKLLVHEANHAYNQKKALQNGTLNFPTKAEEIDCETLALITTANIINKTNSLSDDEIYGKKISSYTDIETIQSNPEFENWLNGYCHLADNLDGDITIAHNPYDKSASGEQIKINSGDVLEFNGERMVIGEDIYLEGLEQTSVTQVILHHKDFSSPDLKGHLIFDGMEPTDFEKTQRLKNFNIDGKKYVSFVLTKADGSIITGKCYL